ncbi:MAG: hypothetical protein ACI94Y_000253 [Maribacter sp.]
MEFTINEADNEHLFPPFSAAINSGNSGTTVALPTTGLTGNYLIYIITADFVGSGGSPSWSNTIQMELNNGGTIYKELAKASVGSADNSNATSLK